MLIDLNKFRTQRTKRTNAHRWWERLPKAGTHSVVFSGVRQLIEKTYDNDEWKVFVYGFKCPLWNKEYEDFFYLEGPNEQRVEINERRFYTLTDALGDQSAEVNLQKHIGTPVVMVVEDWKDHAKIIKQKVSHYAVTQ